jgi:hypothetical protein
MRNNDHDHDHDSDDEQQQHQQQPLQQQRQQGASSNLAWAVVAEKHTEVMGQGIKVCDTRRKSVELRIMFSNAAEQCNENTDIDNRSDNSCGTEN